MARRNTSRSAGEWLAVRCRELREQARLTQQDLADRLLPVGITRTAVAKIEAGTRRVTFDEALALAHALEVPPYALWLPRDDSEKVSVAGEVVSVRQARQWARGQTLLPVRGGKQGVTIMRMTNNPGDNVFMLAYHVRDSEQDTHVAVKYPWAFAIRADAQQLMDCAYRDDEVAVRDTLRSIAEQTKAAKAQIERNRKRVR